MRFAVRCLVPSLLLLGLLMGCGPRSDRVPDADPASGEEASTTSATEEPVSSAEADPDHAIDQPSAPSEPVSQTISLAGGEIVVGDPESPLHRLTITVPEGAYVSATEFTISHHPFEGELPEDVLPLTPVIAVENGGEYANEVMTVSIPIDLPADHFAMGFFVHEDGSLEGMPIVELTQDSITVATMHFSNFLIGMVADALLEQSIDTGFRPGKDDWQFPNYGSYIEPDGHCAGMTITAMWYYLERHLKGESHLYGRYDNNGGERTPDFWEDDSYGYRLASVVQEDIDWDSVSRKLFTTLADVSDTITWKCFLFSMHVTGEPQYVAIHGASGGHAMIVYAVDVEHGELLIADPNYESQARRIQFVDGRFLGYMSAENLEEALAGRFAMFEKIRYTAKTSLVPWDKVAARWSELDAGTIGNGVFPAYTMMVRERSETAVPVPRELTVAAESLVVGFRELPVLADGTAMAGEDVTFAIVKDTSTVPREPGNRIPLAVGENDYGFLVAGKVDGDWEYIDFVRTTIVREAVVPAPPPEATVTVGEIPCEGSEGTYYIPKTTPCSEIPTASAHAEQKRDQLQAGSSAEELASGLTREADNVCAQQPEEGTVGTLYGVDMWGCEHGYVQYNLCRGFYLEKTEPAGTSASYTYRVTMDLGGGGELSGAFDSASRVTTKTFYGTSYAIRVAIALTGSPSSAAVREQLLAAKLGESEHILQEILAYAERYKADYCQALRSIAAGLAPPAAAGIP